MYFTQAIYRLNIMFRHMPVPGDTSVSRQNIIVCCESVGNCQTLSKDGPSQLVNSIIFRPFFCSLCPMPIVSYQFCPVPTYAHHVFCTLLSCLSIARGQSSKTRFVRRHLVGAHLLGVNNIFTHTSVLMGRCVVV